MDNTSFRLVIKFEDEKKLIIFKPHDPMEVFVNYIKTLFKLKADIKIYLSSFQAEITSLEVVQPNDELYVEVNSQALQAPEKQENSTFEVDVIDIKEIKCKEEDLLLEVNQWAMKKKFRLIYAEGRRSLKIGFKRVLKCPVNNCPFKLTFKSGSEENKFHLDLILAKKYNKHSGNS